MRRLQHTLRGRPGWLLAIAIALLLPAAGNSAPTPSSKKDRPGIPSVRWDEETPGCTFSRSTEGKYVYGLRSGDIVVTLAMDAQELEKVRRRAEPFFGVLLTVRYRGPGQLEIDPDKATLEFIKHFKVIQTSLDPDTFSEKVQADTDELDHQTEREIEKHPEETASKQAYMRAFQKDTAELLDFVSKNSMRTVRLDAANSETMGWVLFSTHSKWLGNWKHQEEFIFRIPLEGKIFEFPFKLPPKQGELLLRQRD